MCIQMTIKAVSIEHFKFIKDIIVKLCTSYKLCKTEMDKYINELMISLCMVIHDVSHDRSWEVVF